MIFFDVNENADPILKVGDLVVECYPKNNRAKDVHMFLVVSTKITDLYSLYSVYSLAYNDLTHSGLQAGLNKASLGNVRWNDYRGLRLVRIQDISIRQIDGQIDD